MVAMAPLVHHGKVQKTRGRRKPTDTVRRTLEKGEPKCQGCKGRAREGGKPFGDPK